MLLCRSVAPSHLSCVLWDGGCRNSDFVFGPSNDFVVRAQQAAEVIPVLLGICFGNSDMVKSMRAKTCKKRLEKRVFSFCVSLEFMLP